MEWLALEAGRSDSREVKAALTGELSNGLRKKVRHPFILTLWLLNLRRSHLAKLFILAARPTGRASLTIFRIEKEGFE